MYVRATDAFAFGPLGLTKKERGRIQEILGVQLIETSIGGSTLLGSLVAANSRGAIVADIASERELRVFQDAGLEVMQLAHSRLNAAGNNVVCNDHGAICHPDLSKGDLARISQTLGVEAVHGTVADIGTVGTACFANNDGVLCHPLASPDDLRFASKNLHVPARIGTVNHGHGLVGAGIVANGRGALVGSKTTGIELGRIEEALGFL